jgi:nicotinamide mononucleotide transporter PnuC
LGNNWYIVLGVTICACGGLWSILLNTDDSQPFMDSITTVPAFVAQILMILRYKESWYYWLTIDLGSIIMWSVAGDWCMVAQFVFWSVNCIYGLRKW